MLNVILECHVAGPHALSHEVSACIYILICEDYSCTSDKCGCKDCILNNYPSYRQLMTMDEFNYVKLWFEKILITGVKNMIKWVYYIILYICMYVYLFTWFLVI